MTNTVLFQRTKDELILVERQIRMLRIAKENQPIGIIRLSELMNLPNHKVRYTLRLLERDGLVIATADGAVVTDRYEEFLDEVGRDLKELTETMDRIRKRLPD